MMADQYARRYQPDYAEALADLLPTGPAWPRDPDSVPMQVVEGLAGPWGNEVAGATDQLMEVESFPPSAINMLPDWERCFGLPDACVAEPLTIGDRQNAIKNRMTTQGGQSRAFFEQEAAALGYDITISEFSPYICGISFCGFSNGSHFHPDDPGTLRWQVGPPSIRASWIVHVKGLRFTEPQCGIQQCGEPLGFLALATDLECMLRRYKPAHSDVIFDYSTLYELDFSQPYNSLYLAIGIP